MLLPSQFTQVLPQASASERNDEIFSKDEVNALRYACGYVPRCLLRRYEKYDGDKYMTFVKCLGERAVACEGTVHDFLSYTREWIARVNRGGLFPLNDMTYNIIFFVSVEKEVRASLPTHMTKETDKEAFQEVVINRIVEIDEVQFNWTLVSQCSVSEEDAIELLRDKVSLWVTISSCLPFPLSCSPLQGSSPVTLLRKSLWWRASQSSRMPSSLNCPALKSSHIIGLAGSILSLEQAYNERTRLPWFPESPTAGTKGFRLGCRLFCTKEYTTTLPSSWLLLARLKTACFISIGVLVPDESSSWSTTSTFTRSISHRPSGAPCHVSGDPIPRWLLRTGFSLTRLSGFSRMFTSRLAWPVRGRRTFTIISRNCFDSTAKLHSFFESIFGVSVS